MKGTLKRKRLLIFEVNMSYFNNSHNTHEVPDSSKDIRNPSQENPTQENPEANELNFDMKKSAVQIEIDRVRMLPSNSSYAQHRSRVLAKLLHLMNIKRNASQDEELQLLFAGLSI